MYRIIFLTFLLCHNFLQPVFNCESYDATLNLENANAKILIDEDITNFEGTLHLKDNSPAILTSNANKVISFNSGTFITGDANSPFANNATSFSGQYNLSGTDKLILTSGAILDCSTSGTIYQAVEVGDGTTTLTAKIVGQPYFAQDILVKNNATLEIAIESILNRNIILESTAKLKLLTNLRLGDGVVIQDAAGNANATVYLNNNTLEIGSGTTFNSTGGIIFDQLAGEIGRIILQGNIKVIGTWYFTAGAIIDGRNNWIDWKSFAGSTTAPIYGKLWGSSTTNLVVDNIGIIFPTTGMFQNDTGETFNFLMRGKCRLKLSANHTLTAPTALNVYSRKEGNIIITGAYTLNFSTNCTLRIEYVPLFYDTLDQLISSNISGNITYTESPNPSLVGIQSIVTDSRIFDTFAQLDFTATSTSMMQNHNLTASSTINFLNSTPGTPKTILLDGGGLTINFPDSGSNLFNIQQNTTVTLQNIVLNNFDPQMIGYQSGTLGSLKFGDGVIIKMRKDLTIGFADPAWAFTGNAEIHGTDFTLTLSGEDRLTLTGSNKNLIFDRVNLRPQGAYTFDNQTSAATMTFKNSTIFTGLDGCSIRTGNIDIDGFTKVCGVENSFFGAGVHFSGSYGSTSAWTTAFRDLNKLKIVRRLGFTETNSRCSNLLGRIDVCDVSAYSTNQVVFTVDNANQIWIRTNGTSTRYDTTSDFNVGNIGVDGKSWAIKTNRSVFRIDGVNSFVSAGIFADAITVGNQNNVYILQNDTGRVFQCSNPTSGTPTTWTQISNIASPKGIAAGLDGTLWYIDSLGRVFKRVGTQETLVHDGTGKDFNAISVSGDKDSNFLALKTTLANGGRILVSRNNEPLKDLGIPKIANMAIGINGSIVLTLDSNAFVDEPGLPTRQPIWERFSGGQDLSLFLDKTFTFSSDDSMGVLSGSTLQICDGATLFYNGNSSNNESTEEAKTHFYCQDQSATLQLLDGNLNTGHKGILLDSGRFIVQGLCSLTTSFAPNKQAILTSLTNAIIRDGSKLQVYGKLDYSQTDRA